MFTCRILWCILMIILIVCYIGEFDEDQAGKRMRLPIPETWETQVSLRGNKAEVWESLIGKFMRLIL